MRSISDVAIKRYEDPLEDGEAHVNLLEEFSIQIDARIDKGKRGPYSFLLSPNLKLI